MLGGGGLWGLKVKAFLNILSLTRHPTQLWRKSNRAYVCALFYFQNNKPRNFLQINNIEIAYKINSVALESTDMSKLWRFQSKTDFDRLKFICLIYQKTDNNLLVPSGLTLKSILTNFLIKFNFEVSFESRAHFIFKYPWNTKVQAKPDNFYFVQVENLTSPPEKK